MTSDFYTIDDLQVKHKTPNHLAAPVEKYAAAGAKLPHSLAQRIAYLQKLTRLAQQLLSAVLGNDLAISCQVVNAKDNKITIGLPSMTATNHVHYLQASCLDVLRQDKNFVQFDTLKVVLSTPKSTTPPSVAQNNLSQNNSKKLLSENTKRNITQHTSVVITNKNLRNSLLQLADCIKTTQSNE